MVGRMWDRQQRAMPTMARRMTLDRPRKRSHRVHHQHNISMRIMEKSPRAGAHLQPYLWRIPIPPGRKTTTKRSRLSIALPHRNIKTLKRHRLLKNRSHQALQSSQTGMDRMTPKTLSIGHSGRKPTTWALSALHAGLGKPPFRVVHLQSSREAKSVLQSDQSKSLTYCLVPTPRQSLRQAILKSCKSFTAPHQLLSSESLSS